MTLELKIFIFWIFAIAVFFILTSLNFVIYEYRLGSDSNYHNFKNYQRYSELYGFTYAIFAFGCFVWFVYGLVLIANWWFHTN